MSTLIGPIENENEYAAKKRRRKQETSRLAKKAKRSRPANYIDYNAAVFVKCLSTREIHGIGEADNDNTGEDHEEPAQR